MARTERGSHWPWLLWEIAKAGWDVTKIILHPDLPITPEQEKLGR